MNALKKALENGFAYNYVLDADAAWDVLRTSARWKALKKQFADQLYSIDYYENVSEAPNAIEYSIPGFNASKK